MKNHGESDDVVDRALTTTGLPADVALTELSLTELSPTEWRVTKALAAENDPAGLLGFIQRVGPAYEVTNLGRLRERSYFSSFNRATASLAPSPLRRVRP